MQKSPNSRITGSKYRVAGKTCQREGAVDMLKVEGPRSRDQYSIFNDQYSMFKCKTCQGEGAVDMLKVEGPRSKDHYSIFNNKYSIINNQYSIFKWFKDQYSIFNDQYSMFKGKTCQGEGGAGMLKVEGPRFKDHDSIFNNKYSIFNNQYSMFKGKTCQGEGAVDMLKVEDPMFKDHYSIFNNKYSIFNNKYSIFKWFEDQYSIFNIQYSMFRWVLGFIFLFFISSCTTVKDTTYFQGIKKDTTLTNLVSKDFEPKIQKGDLLSITIASLSPENTAIYNAPQNMEGTATGYLVDKNGNIDFFKLDTLHVEGMTRQQLKERLEKDLTPYLAQTVVAVGFLNRHVTMIGALSSIVPMASDNMTLLDAISSAGGLGDRALKNDIMVIRQKDNGKEFKKLDLTDESIFYSPYFYLQPNDIIYIKPVKKKTENVTRVISFVTAAITFTFFIIDRIIK